jgi:O-methyltransferase
MKPNNAPTAHSNATEVRDAYLDICERALTFSLYEALDGRMRIPRGLRVRIEPMLRRAGHDVVRLLPPDSPSREDGRDWPLFAQTMIGRRRLASLRACVEQVLVDEVPGDLIEAGVWRGGASILMRAVLKAYGVRDRTVWLADSFAGLPRPQAGDHSADRDIPWDKFSELAISEEAVRANFERYGLLDGQVRFVRGWFRDTMPGLAGREWSVIRLDGDTYASTTDALTALYPGLAPGGYLIVDDYGALVASRDAVHDFRDAHGIVEPIERVDWTGAYWRRET